MRHAAFPPSPAFGEKRTFPHVTLFVRCGNVQILNRICLGATPKNASAVIPACNLGRKAQRSRLSYSLVSS